LTRRGPGRQAAVRYQPVLVISGDSMVTSSRASRRHLSLLAAVAGAAVLLSAAPAAASPPANVHDCAGKMVSSGAGPGFGQVVSAAAHEQIVDNFGYADCGQTNRSNT
jgi:hypothetical protein